MYRIVTAPTLEELQEQVNIVMSTRRKSEKLALWRPTGGPVPIYGKKPAGAEAWIQALKSEIYDYEDIVSLFKGAGRELNVFEKKKREE